MKRLIVALTAATLASFSVSVPGCTSAFEPTEEPARPEREPESEPGSLSLTSSAFGEGDSIPVRYSCDGQDMSPPLVWENAPAGTQAFALIMDDPDAPGGVLTHWVLWNLPADSGQLSEKVPVARELPNGGLQGRNSFGSAGYDGPCPPIGQNHRYRFTLYALDGPLDLAGGATERQLLDAMQGHILGEVALTGNYRR